MVVSVAVAPHDDAGAAGVDSAPPRSLHKQQATLRSIVERYFCDSWVVCVSYKAANAALKNAHHHMERDKDYIACSSCKRKGHNANNKYCPNLVSNKERKNEQLGGRKDKDRDRDGDEYGKGTGAGQNPEPRSMRGTGSARSVRRSRRRRGRTRGCTWCACCAR